LKETAAFCLSFDLLTFLDWNWTCNSLLHFLHY